MHLVVDDQSPILAGEERQVGELLQVDGVGGLQAPPTGVIGEGLIGRDRNPPHLFHRLDWKHLHSVRSPLLGRPDSKTQFAWTPIDWVFATLTWTMDMGLRQWSSTSSRRLWMGMSIRCLRSIIEASILGAISPATCLEPSNRSEHSVASAFTL